MHALAGQEQSLEQLGTKFLELLVKSVAHELEYLLNLLNEDDLLAWASDGPELKQTENERHVQLVRLF